jgi:hypothetical protein
VSSDDDDTPSPRRSQSATERDLEGIRARKERDNGVPAEVWDEYTDRYEGEELKSLRATRSHDDRLTRLEDKHDSLVSTVTETRVLVGETRVLVGELKTAVDRSAAKEHATFIDELDAKKARRERITKAIGLLVAALSSGAVMHWLASKL